MNISERIRRANGEKPDYAIDDIGDIGHWQGMNDAALIAEAEELIQLTDDQQVVLNWLKNKYTDDADSFGTIAYLFSQSPKSEVIIASLKINKLEQAQVLQAFATWTLEQE